MTAPSLVQAASDRPPCRSGGGRVRYGSPETRTLLPGIFGAAEVAAKWHTDGWMRSQMRRWIAKAEALVDGGWRDLVPRYVSDE